LTKIDLKLDNFIEKMKCLDNNTYPFFYYTEIPNKKDELNILYDVKMNVKITSSDKLLINLFKDRYLNYFRNINNQITFFKLGDETHLIKYLYEFMISFISSLELHKIPYNKYYMSLINNYYQDNLNNLFGFGEPIKNKIIKYYSHLEPLSIKKINSSQKYSQHKNLSSRENKDNKPRINIQLIKEPYTYSHFDNSIESLSIVKSVRHELLQNYGGEPLQKITRIAEDFTRGISNYLFSNYKLPYHPSNAFCKVWEILSIFDFFDLRKTTFKSFHFAEAPGQFIWSLEYFLNKTIGKEITLDWRANSLNPKHPKNIRIFGKNIFSDDYGFIRKYPDRWFYGKDGTGDILISDNVRYMRKQVMEDGIPDIVSGDAGLPSEVGLKLVQHLEFGQVCMVMATCGIGKHCIVKHFTPFINSQPESEMAGGSFVNMIYLYNLMFREVYLFKPYTSRPSSGEFYVIGKHFYGVSDVILNKTLEILDNFEINQCYFSKKSIPESFSRQVFNFVSNMSNMNINTIERQNFFMTCIVNDDPILRKHTKCLQYLDENNLKKLHNSRFKEWTRLYNFK
jgi:hypothetical protein